MVMSLRKKGQISIEIMYSVGVLLLIFIMLSSVTFTKKLDVENLGVKLGTLDGGFDLEISKGDPKKLSDLINGSLKDKIIYKSGSRTLSGADVAWLAIKSYGNDEQISNEFKKYAGELAGAGDSRKVGARKESKKLNSKLLRRLILKTLKENGEL